MDKIKATIEIYLIASPGNEFVQSRSLFLYEHCTIPLCCDVQYDHVE